MFATVRHSTTQECTTYKETLVKFKNENRNIFIDFMIMHTMTVEPADAIGQLVTFGLHMSYGIQDK